VGGDQAASGPRGLSRRQAAHPARQRPAREPGLRDGAPSYVMSSSFANQTIAQIELWSQRDSGRYPVASTPCQAPRREGGRLQLRKLNAKLTELDGPAGHVHRRRQARPVQVRPLPILMPGRAKARVAWPSSEALRSRRAPLRRAPGRAVLATGRSHRRRGSLLQVLQEFFAVATRRLGLAPEAAAPSRGPEPARVVAPRVDDLLRPSTSTASTRSRSGTHRSCGLRWCRDAASSTPRTCSTDAASMPRGREPVPLRRARRPPPAPEGGASAHGGGRNGRRSASPSEATPRARRCQY